MAPKKRISKNPCWCRWKTKKILSLKITHDSSHDAAHLPELVEQASQKGNVVKVLAEFI